MKSTGPIFAWNKKVFFPVNDLPAGYEIKVIPAWLCIKIIIRTPFIVIELLGSTIPFCVIAIA